MTIYVDMFQFVTLSQSHINMHVQPLTLINSFNPIGGSGWCTLITDPQALVAATIVVILVLAVMKCCKPENSAILNRTNNRAH